MPHGKSRIAPLLAAQHNWLHSGHKRSSPLTFRVVEAQIEIVEKAVATQPENDTRCVKRKMGTEQAFEHASAFIYKFYRLACEKKRESRFTPAQPT